MAVLTATSMVAVHEEKKGIHPFFENRSKSYERVAQKLSLDQSGPFLENSTPKQNGRENVGSNMAQREDWSNIGSEDKLLEIELNFWRRKRRKSASPKPEDVESQSVCKNEALSDSELREGRRRAIKGTRKDRLGKGDFENCGADSRSATANIKQTSADTIELIKVFPINSHVDAPHLPSYQPREREPSDQKSQKILRLNPTTGTIGSPPKKISSIIGVGRSKASLNKATNLIIKMKYGTDESVRLSVGQKISNLLSGIEVAEGLHEKAGKKAAPYPPQPVLKGPEPLKQIVCSRPTHPFFLGKLLPTSESTDPVVEHVILAKEVPTHKNFPVEKARSISPGKPQPPVGPPLQLHVASNATKISRGVEPCWPPKDMFHLRGREPNSRQRELSFVHAASRKSKYLATEPSAKNSVLKTVGKKLDIGQVLHDLKQIDTSAFTKPESCLRIPKKQFVTGLEIQKRIRRELHTSFPSACDSSEDEIQGEGLHPALRKVYELIASTLSAFDRSECETQSWIHKYAPSSASDVLQIGKEAFILKDWLQTLTVMAVDDGSRSRTAPLSSRRSSSKLSRRKRKTKLETFIVSSDEEDYEFDVISEPEDESLRSQKSRKTVIRTNHNKEAGKQMNAVIISGPCGCGKTAMVYAVAKELGFEVFEINPSSRRNGKDILEKVGDMTRNHLVRRSEIQGGSEASESSGAELKSGRQKTVNSFFKARLESKKQHVIDSEDRHQKAQTQSLILLEEVDILFEEDKQFWTTVMTLIVQSKRPIIMTCNDEALVPLQTLPLHAIIRLSPPPLDLAVDYMLLVAAAEGHIIQRQAVEALFNSRRWDLRASITELDYWCQFGVGDRKGGFDWFYPRWPPGSDIDAEGNTVRVVSEDTYETGMGWLGRDSQYNGDDQSFQEELLHETGRSWQIDLDMTETLEGSFLELSSYKSFVDSMSLADLCTYGSLSTDYRTPFDVTIPPLSAKARDDFAVGYGLLQAETRMDVNVLEEQISSSIKLRARNQVRPDTTILSNRHIIQMITNFSYEKYSISRQDFNLAFDPIATTENYPPSRSSSEASAFDRTTTVIAVDLAPFVRSIVAHDVHLQLERSRLGNLVCEGGRKSKRLRTTRSSLSALEGGTRRTTLPACYFGTTLNPHLVMKTGLQYWQDAVAAEVVRNDKI